MKSHHKKRKHDKKSSQKVQYFDVNGFVEDVITAMRLHSMDEEQLEEMRGLIVNRLSDRIMSTTLNAFGPREMQLMQTLLEDHAELDSMDAIFVVSQQIDGMKERLEAGINDLYEELIWGAEQIDALIAEREAKKAENSLKKSAKADDSPEQDLIF